MTADQTYEMLWDCRYCGQRKNLGLTHRHCPNCGAPQNAADRYFPSDDEKVAVESHVYVGADLKCPYCERYASRAAKHCGGCGAPLTGATEAARRQDQLTAGHYAGEAAMDAQRERAPANAAAANASAPAKKPRWPLFVGIGCGGLLLLVIAFVLVMVFWKREGALEVVGHTWKREIQVERFGPSDESSWCDQVPASAKIVRRTREVRSHEQVPDGEECRTRRVDKGDGTYTERQECTAKYRKEPVYADRCHYMVNKWQVSRTETASGMALTDEPRWPDPKLTNTGQCVGCEREAKRSESYVVRLLEREKNEEVTCEFDRARWASFAAGSKWTGQLSVIGGIPDCSSLKAR
jgi:hypothetical protein